MKRKMSRMYEDFASLTANDVSRETPRSLSVVLACEDYSAGMHALWIFDGIFSAHDKKLADGAQSIWKFDLLSISSLRKIAAEEAAAADLIIVSAHSPGNLADTVREWIEMGLAQRTHRPGALALLLDETGDGKFDQFPVAAWLNERATQAGMEFFAHKASGRMAFDDSELAMDFEKTAQTLAALRNDLSLMFGRQFKETLSGAAKALFEV